jgi:hypothetical protein
MRYLQIMDSNDFRESPAAGLKKWDRNFRINLDPAFKEDSDPAAINCADIKKKPIPQPIEIEKNNEKNTNKKKNEKPINWLEVFIQKFEQSQREYIAAICAESGRTQEWAETSGEYKRDHYDGCAYCGEYSNIECHDIEPYHRLTEDQRHDRDFLMQNFILLCHNCHQNVAHMGDQEWIKFDPKIREICEREKQERYAKELEEQERYAELSTRPASFLFLWNQEDEDYYLAEYRRGLPQFTEETHDNFYTVDENSEHRLKFKCPVFGNTASNPVFVETDGKEVPVNSIGSILIYINPANDQAEWYCPKCSMFNSKSRGCNGKSVKHSIPRGLRDELVDDGIFPIRGSKHKDRLAEKLFGIIRDNPGASFYELDHLMEWGTDGRNSSERIINKHLKDRVDLRKRRKGKGYQVYIR